jgi:hypothetical protein
VALQGPSGLHSDRIDTVPYIPGTFDRVLRIHALLFTPRQLTDPPIFTCMGAFSDPCFVKIRGPCCGRHATLDSLSRLTTPAAAGTPNLSGEIHPGDHNTLRGYLSKGLAIPDLLSNRTSFLSAVNRLAASQASGREYSSSRQFIESQERKSGPCVDLRKGFSAILKDFVGLYVGSRLMA